jgi:hypothetical protein
MRLRDSSAAFWRRFANTGANPRLWAIVALCGGSGCTSFSWRDRDGVDHHVGLVACEVTELASGLRFRRCALGLDFRWTSPEIGWSLGFKSIEGRCPEVRPVSAGALGPSVAAFLESRDSIEPAKSRGWRFFWFSDEEQLADRITVLHSRHVGVEIVQPGRGPRFSAGFSRRDEIVGKASGDGIAQVHVIDGEHPEHEELVLWDLGANP